MKLAQRDSNIELLRIIATFFIIILHCNGWFLQMEGISCWFCGDYVVGSIRIAIQSITRIGVILFVLISGFYGIRPKLKSLINLFTLLLFFYVGCYLLDCHVGKDSFSWSSLLKNCMVFSRENWFINCYLFLILLSPILNAFTEKVQRKYLTIYLCVFLACAFYWGLLKPSNYFYFNQGYSVTTMVLIYLVGRYMNLHMKKWVMEIRYRYLLIAYLVSLLLLIVAFVVEIHIGKTLTGYCSPFDIVSAICFFWLFYRLPSFSSRFVNWIGESCLACFIFHTCSPIMGWLSAKDYSLYVGNPYLIYAGKMFLIIIAVFSVSILLDKVRLLIFRPVINAVGAIKALN